MLVNNFVYLGIRHAPPGAGAYLAPFTLPRVKRPSAPAGKTGLSAGARQAGTVTAGRAPVDAGGGLSRQAFTRLRFLAARAFTWRLTFRSSSSSLALS